MNIAIVGAGVAGSYLGAMLHKQGHDVQIFESSNKEKHWPICAWAGPRNILSRFSKQAGLNFDNYILHIGKEARIRLTNNELELLDISGFVTYDKYTWESDLLKGVNVNYGVRYTRNTFPFGRYDYVVDCTGVHRELLPRSKQDFLVPSYEYLVENVYNMYDFYIINYKSGNGYFWYFPIGFGRGFVGAGDTDRIYYGIQEFFKQHPEAKIIKKIGRPIRLAPPKRMEPFKWKNVVGVGESIGCVFPITGEGIAPSLICCDIFLDLLKDEQKNFDFILYRRKILETFEYYDDVYRIFKLMMNGKLNHITDKIDDVRRILINSPIAAVMIKNFVRKIEFISTINEFSERVEYPIIDYDSLIKKAGKNEVLINNEVISLNDLKVEIPVDFFPIYNQTDLISKARELFNKLRAQSFFFLLCTLNASM
jgi:flavin-dependent dehydrogenase